MGETNGWISSKTAGAVSLERLTYNSFGINLPVTGSWTHDCLVIYLRILWWIGLGQLDAAAKMNALAGLALQVWIGVDANG